MAWDFEYPVDRLHITITATCIDSTGKVVGKPITETRTLCSCDNEFKRLRKKFWEVLTLIFVDSWLPTPLQKDEITGYPGFRLGKKVRKGVKDV